MNKYEDKLCGFAIIYGVGVDMSENTDIRLHEGELNVMELLWSNKELAAKDIANIIKEYIGWEKNTTYTVIKRLIDKGAIERTEPGFICRAIVTKQKIQQIEIKCLLDKLFSGSFQNMLNEYLKSGSLSSSEREAAIKLLSKYNG